MNQGTICPTKKLRKLEKCGRRPAVSKFLVYAKQMNNSFLSSMNTLLSTFNTTVCKQCDNAAVVLDAMAVALITRGGIPLHAPHSSPTAISVLGMPSTSKRRANRLSSRAVFVLADTYVAKQHVAEFRAFLNQNGSTELLVLSGMHELAGSPLCTAEQLGELLSIPNVRVEYLPTPPVAIADGFCVLSTTLPCLFGAAVNGHADNVAERAHTEHCARQLLELEDAMGVDFDVYSLGQQSANVSTRLLELGGARRKRAQASLILIDRDLDMAALAVHSDHILDRCYQHYRVTYARAADGNDADDDESQDEHEEESLAAATTRNDARAPLVAARISDCLPLRVSARLCDASQRAVLHRLICCEQEKETLAVAQAAVLEGAGPHAETCTSVVTKARGGAAKKLTALIEVLRALGDDALLRDSEWLGAIEIVCVLSAALDARLIRRWRECVAEERVVAQELDTYAQRVAEGDSAAALEDTNAMLDEQLRRVRAEHGVELAFRLAVYCSALQWCVTLFDDDEDETGRRRALAAVHKSACRVAANHDMTRLIRDHRYVSLLSQLASLLFADAQPPLRDLKRHRRAAASSVASVFDTGLRAAFGAATGVEERPTENREVVLCVLGPVTADEVGSVHRALARSRFAAAGTVVRVIGTGVWNGDMHSLLAS